MIEYLGLQEPIYTKTTNYGHFGKKDLPWERKIELKQKNVEKKGTNFLDKRENK